MDAIYALTLTFKYARMRKCATLNCCWTFTIWWRWLNAYPTSECIFKHFKFPKRNITPPFCKNTEMNYKKFTNDMALNKNGDIHHRSLSPEKVFKTNEKHVEDHWIYYVSPEASLVEWRKCRTETNWNGQYTLYPQLWDPLGQFVGNSVSKNVEYRKSMTGWSIGWLVRQTESTQRNKWDDCKQRFLSPQSHAQLAKGNIGLN